MVKEDKNALICDFAETYRIYDYRALPARLAATYACGLKADSRIMLKLAGTKAPAETMLLAMIADFLQTLVWQNTKDGHSGKNPPKSITRSILGEENRQETGSFHSVEEFNAWRAAMLGSEKHA